MRIFGATHQGKVRNENQDALAYRMIGDDTAYAIVCDGMGGEKAGDVASTTTCQIIAKFLQRDITPNMNESAAKSVILSAISAANAKVYSMAKESPNYEKMGTTLVLVVILGNIMHVANIGDSRIYLWDGQSVRQITRDHTVVQTMIDRGEIDEEQASIHPQRHYITRAVGVGDNLDIDYQLIELPFFNTKEANDKSGEQINTVLLCSDGLCNYLKVGLLPEMLELCAKQENVQCLIDFANSEGGSDNITAVTVFL